ncbi:hypothetical protein AXF42_Ash018825 [Apostasia shenzhenica]|uniref:Uncharacterized protein n=1 Tax=Apostasia shenzhenica TaxID=1088818 RepID=A0A2I0B161_9ASPA|nr:hypothetical protein AXF42_Ash018825 [Apostasia shenzhenica]
MGETGAAAGDGWRSEGALSGVSSCSYVWELNPYNCHRCRCLCVTEFLESDWRLVTLCRNCHTGVKSAKVCSYCFSGFRKLETGLLNCRLCSRRVHRGCIPLHHRNLSLPHLNAITFFCIDCCPIPKFRGRYVRNSGNTVSRSVFRVSLNLAQKGKFIEAKKLNDERKLREKAAEKSTSVRGNIAEKAMAATGASGLVRNALGAIHLVKKPSYAEVSIPDEELALQLHREMNGSQRISRTSCHKETSRLSVPKKVESTNSACLAVEDRCSTHHGHVDVCIENKSLMETSELFLSTSPFLQPENKALMKQIGRSNSDCPVGFSLNEKQCIQEFRDSTGDCMNIGSALTPAESSNNWSSSTISLTNCTFDDENILSEMQQKGIDVQDQHRHFQKYFRRRWNSRRILWGNES